MKKKHIIKYTGSMKYGFGWHCSCGVSSPNNWAESFDRITEAHDHLIENRIYPRWMTKEMVAFEEAKYV